VQVGGAWNDGSRGEKSVVIKRLGKGGAGYPVAMMGKKGGKEGDIPRHSSNNCIVSVLIGKTFARSLSADKTCSLAQTFDVGWSANPIDVVRE
jgi:hypothetical protein